MFVVFESALATEGAQYVRVLVCSCDEEESRVEVKKWIRRTFTWREARHQRAPRKRQPSRKSGERDVEPKRK